MERPAGIGVRMLDGPGDPAYWMPMPFAALVSLSCATLVLNLLAFMTVAAVLPELIRAWALSSTEAGWLGGSFFAGYVAAVPLVMGLSDRIQPKLLFVAGAMTGAVASFGFALMADGLWSGIAFRLLTGVGVAGTYMPALKCLADSLEEPRRSRATSYYTSVFALGTALSIWAGGAAAEWLDWRWAFGLAGAGHIAGLVLGLAVLPTGNASAAGGARHMLDFRPVFRNGPAMRNVLVYFTHTWEVFALRVWGVTFLVFVEAHQGRQFAVSPVTIAMLIALAGVPASMGFGELAARWDRRKAMMALMAASVATGTVVGLSAGWPLWAVFALVILFGMTCYGDTGAVTAGTVALAEPHLRGATMAVHAAVGFLGGVAGPLAVGVTLDAAGGIGSATGWFWAFLVMAGGSAAGAVLMAGAKSRR
jgi:MFS family permease